MTDDQYERARVLQGEIRELEFSLGSIDDNDPNWLRLPKEMWERHKQEKVSFVKSKIERLKQEFAAL